MPGRAVGNRANSGTVTAYGCGRARGGSAFQGRSRAKSRSVSYFGDSGILTEEVQVYMPKTVGNQLWKII